MEDNNNNPIVQKNARGRQKVTLEKITDEEKLGVTFSKRRNGLFKKASDLATLCGAELALFTVSPGGRVYSFGSPSVDAVVQRYLSGFHHAPSLPEDFAASISRRRNEVVVTELYAQLQRLEEAVEAEKSKAKELRKKRMELEKKFWMATPIHTMSRPQLLEMKAHLLRLSEEFARQVVSGHGVSMRVNNNASINVTNNDVTAAIDVNAGSSSADPPAVYPVAQMILPPLSPPWPVLDQINMVLDTNMVMTPTHDDGCDVNIGGFGGRDGAARFY